MAVLGSFQVQDRPFKLLPRPERRLSSLIWNYTQYGQRLDRKAGISALCSPAAATNTPPPVKGKPSARRSSRAGNARPAVHCAVCATGPCCFWASPAACADPSRRPRCCARSTDDGRGWIEFYPYRGVLVTWRGNTGGREVEFGRGSSDATCLVVALWAWLKLARIAHGPSSARHRSRQSVGSRTVLPSISYVLKGAFVSGPATMKSISRMPSKANF